MPNLGFGELLVILVIVTLLFGGKRLPQIGDALGRSVKNFKRAFNGDDEIDVTPKKAIGQAEAAKSVEGKAPAPVDAKIEG